MLKLRPALIAVSLAATVTVSACSNMNDTQQRVLSGAAIGSGVGLAAGALTGGSLLTGGLIGGAVGAGGGYLYDQSKKGR